MKQDLGRRGLSWFTAFLLVAFLWNAFGCVSREKREEEKKEVAALETKLETAPGEARHAAVETGADLSAELEFRRNSDQLTPDSGHELQRFLGNAVRKGEFDKVTVIAWADRDYPAGNRLDREDRELAGRRTAVLRKAVEDTLKQKNKPRFTEVNMAERPEAWREWLGDKETAVKNSLEEAGIANDGGHRPDRASKVAKGMLLVTLERKK